jgi:hypothetical protein
MRLCLVLAVVLFMGVAAHAGEDGSKKTFALPIEFDTDFGAENGNALILRFIPLNRISVSRKWKLINIAVATVVDAPGGVPGLPGNPDPVGDGRAFGLGDLLDIAVFTPRGSRKVIWGVGPMFGLPTATDERLGSGKWTAGPAARLAYRQDPWRLGLVLGNHWSFAGDSDRSDVNQLLIRGLIARDLKNEWFLTYSPIITANWNAPSGQRWVVPLGGGLGKRFELGSLPVSLAIQGFANVVKPDGAPDTIFRITLVTPIPRS